MASNLPFIPQAKNWQIKVGALNALRTLAKTAPRQIARCLPDIVPKLTGGCMRAAVKFTKTCRLASGG